MKKRNLSILLVLVILVLIIIRLFFIYPKTTGKIIAEKSDKFICKDSDGGKDFYVQGAIKQGDVVKGTDYCTSDTRLKEYYCLTNTSTLHYYYECEYKCEDGACVEEEKESEEIIKDDEVGVDENVEEIKDDDKGEVRETKPSFFQTIIKWFKRFF